MTQIQINWRTNWKLIGEQVQNCFGVLILISTIRQLKFSQQMPTTNDNKERSSASRILRNNLFT